MHHSTDSCAGEMLLPGQGPLDHQTPLQRPAENTHCPRAA